MHQRCNSWASAQFMMKSIHAEGNSFIKEMSAIAISLFSAIFFAAIRASRSIYSANVRTAMRTSYNDEVKDDSCQESNCAKYKADVHHHFVSQKCQGRHKDDNTKHHDTNTDPSLCINIFHWFYIFWNKKCLFPHSYSRNTLQFS